jgi:hypothetical protein
LLSVCQSFFFVSRHGSTQGVWGALSYLTHLVLLFRHRMAWKEDLQGRLLCALASVRSNWLQTGENVHIGLLHTHQGVLSHMMFADISCLCGGASS